MDRVREYDSNKLLYHTDRVNCIIEGGNPAPVTVEFSVTNRCNYDCVWCSESRYRSEYPRAELPARLVLDTVKDMSAMGVRAITWEGGGEPLVHKDFSMIMELAEGDGIHHGLVTNGSRLRTLSNDAIRKLDWIRVSFDASNADMFECVHRVPLFGDVVKSIEHVAGVEGRGILGLSYIVSEDTKAGVLDAAILARELGVDYIRFKAVIGAQHKLKFYDSEEVMARAKELETDKFSVYYSRFDDRDESNIVKKHYKHCYAHRIVGYVCATGSVELCCDIKQKYCHNEFSFGNLHYQSFRDIWRGKRRMDLIHTVETDTGFLRKYCVDCRMNNYNMMMEGMKEGQFSPLWRFL